MINFQNEIQNLVKSTHFEKFIFIQQMFNTKHVIIGATICIYNYKLQKISFKNSFIQTNENIFLKTHSLFVK
jgi:hypothetical protein